MPAHLLASALASQDSEFGDVREDALGTHLLTAHQPAATSFLRLPIPRRRIWDMVFGPEIRAYNWVATKLNHTTHDLWQKYFDPMYVSPDQARMVFYTSGKGCKACETMTPIWNEAKEEWSYNDAQAHKVAWREKQCLDESGNPGKDATECKAAGVSEFPAIRFYAPGSDIGDDFIFERSKRMLKQFAESGLDPQGHGPPLVPRSSNDDRSDLKIIDFYAASCPHCKALDPIWSAGQKKWEAFVETHKDQDPPIVTFEKKECYDSHWKPGKDYDLCKKHGIKGYPTVRLFEREPDNHGFEEKDGEGLGGFDGPRTPDAIRNFLVKRSNMELSAKEEEVPSFIRDAKPLLPDDHVRTKSTNHIDSLTKGEESRHGTEPSHTASSGASASPKQASAQKLKDEALETAAAALSGDKKAVKDAQAAPSKLGDKVAGDKALTAQDVKSAAMAPLPLVGFLPAYTSESAGRQRCPQKALANFL